MTLDDQILNELAWAIETTAKPPRVPQWLKPQIAYEYARLHRVLADIDRAHRGWTIHKRDKEKSPQDLT